MYELGCSRGNLLPTPPLGLKRWGSRAVKQPNAVGVRGPERYSGSGRALVAYTADRRPHPFLASAATQGKWETCKAALVSDSHGPHGECEQRAEGRPQVERDTDPR